MPWMPNILQMKQGKNFNLPWVSNKSRFRLMVVHNLLCCICSYCLFLGHVGRSRVPLFRLATERGIELVAERIILDMSESAKVPWGGKTNIFDINFRFWTFYGDTVIVIRRHMMILIRTRIKVGRIFIVVQLRNELCLKLSWDSDVLCQPTFCLMILSHSIPAK